MGWRCYRVRILHCDRNHKSRRIRGQLTLANATGEEAQANRCAAGTTNVTVRASIGTILLGGLISASKTIEGSHCRPGIGESPTGPDRKSADDILKRRLKRFEIL